MKVMKQDSQNWLRSVMPDGGEPSINKLSVHLLVY